MRSERAARHGPAALVSAAEDGLPVFRQRMPALLLLESQLDENAASMAGDFFMMFAVGAQDGHGAPTRWSSASAWTDCPAVDRTPLLVEQPQSRVGQPTGIAKARCVVFIFDACLCGQCQSLLVVRACASMVERLFDRPSAGPVCDVLAKEELPQLLPPYFGVIARLDVNVSQTCAERLIVLDVSLRATCRQGCSWDCFPYPRRSLSMNSQHQPAVSPRRLGHASLA